MFLLLIIIIHDDNNNSNNNEFCLIYDIYVYIYYIYIIIGVGFILLYFVDTSPWPPIIFSVALRTSYLKTWMRRTATPRCDL